MTASTPAPCILDWAWAGAGLGGEPSGDLHLVELFAHGALLAVIDGLGHGPEAAAASLRAVTILRAEPERPLQDLLPACHEALRKTRGAVMSLISLDTRSVTFDWCGIGNVEGVLLRAQPNAGRASEAITPRGGVVGYRMPSVKVSTLPLHPRDVFILATDGIRSGFVTEVDRESEPQAIADRVFAHRTDADDALVLVARYLGGRS